MARRNKRPKATVHKTLEPLYDRCPVCGGRLWTSYHNYRTVATLEGLVHLTLKIRRCQNPLCERFRKPYRPEEEGAYALPESEFGLDVIALVGALRYSEHRSVPEIHRELLHRKVLICERTVINLLDRYDELVALSLTEDRRLREITEAQGRVILAIDGLQPEVGQEVLWVLRDSLSGEVLLSRSLLSATEEDLAELILQVKRGLEVPIVGVISDGQRSIRNAVKRALPGLPHQLCHFHYLREVSKPIFEADRHAKKELKKRIRGVRPIERMVEDRSDPEADVVRGYCLAVRSSLTDDGKPPLSAGGLRLRERLLAIKVSLDSLSEKRDFRGNS